MVQDNAIDDPSRPPEIVQNWCTKLLSQLNSQRRQKSLCDAELLSHDGVPVAAHACILSAASPLLAEQLKTQKSLSILPTVKTNLPHSVLEYLVSLVYTGRLENFRSGVDLVDASKSLGFTLWPGLLQSHVEQQRTAEPSGLLCEEVDIWTESREPSAVPDERHILLLEDSLISTGGRPTSKNDRMPVEPLVKETSEKETNGVHGISKSKPHKASTNLKGGSTYPCSVCQSSFLSAKRLREHLRSHVTSRSFKCAQCSKSFPQRAFLKSHMKTHLTERPFKCQGCKAAFRRKDTLREHEHIHAENPRVFLCRYCAKQLKTKSSLRTHEKYHVGEKSFKCTDCEMAFVRFFDLRRHKQKFHMEDSPNRCKVCGKFCDGPEALRRHSRTHSGERPYQCDVCPAAFKQSGQLNTHKRSHSDERPFSCCDCSKKFKTRVHLKRHLLTHQTDRPFKCPHCEKGFNASDNLKTHIRTHSGERPYVCAFCARTFICSSNLKVHEKLHANDTGQGKKRINFRWHGSKSGSTFASTENVLPNSCKK